MTTEVDWTHSVIYDLQITAELLSLRGHKVYAIDYESKWQKQGTWDLISKRQEVNVARAYPKSSVKLITPSFIKVPILSRASAWVTSWATIEDTIRDFHIDVIILYSVPTNGLQALRIAKTYGIPVVFRSIDTLNQLVHNRLLSGVTRLMEREIYSKADLILPINYRLSQYVVSMGANPNRVRVLPLGVDTDMFKPDMNVAKWKSVFGFGDTDKVIVFVGTLPRFSGLDRFISVFPQIIKEVPEAKLLIVGGGEQQEYLQHLIDELHLRDDKTDDVIITGYQPHDRIPDFINLATICVNPFPICGATRDIFPTKVIQYMACAKPVVSTPLPGITDMVRESINGIMYTNNWADTIVKLLKSPSRLDMLGRAGLQYVKRVHDYGGIIDQLETELARV